MLETRYKMALEAIVEMVSKDTTNGDTVIAGQCKAVAEKALGVENNKQEQQTDW